MTDDYSGWREFYEMIRDHVRDQKERQLTNYDVTYDSHPDKTINGWTE